MFGMVYKYVHCCWYSRFLLRLLCLLCRHMLCYAMLWYHMLRYAMLWCDMICYAILWCAMVCRWAWPKWWRTLTSLMANGTLPERRRREPSRCASSEITHHFIHTSYVLIWSQVWLVDYAVPYTLYPFVQRQLRRDRIVLLSDWWRYISYLAEVKWHLLLLFSDWLTDTSHLSNLKWDIIVLLPDW